MHMTFSWRRRNTNRYSPAQIGKPNHFEVLETRTLLSGSGAAEALVEARWAPSAGPLTQPAQFVRHQHEHHRSSALAGQAHTNLTLNPAVTNATPRGYS